MSAKKTLRSMMNSTKSSAEGIYENGYILCYKVFCSLIGNRICNIYYIV